MPSVSSSNTLRRCKGMPRPDHSATDCLLSARQTIRSRVPVLPGAIRQNLLAASVRPTSAPFAIPPIFSAHIDEWHLVLGNAFRHLAFHLGAGLGQPAVVVAPPLLHPWLVPIRAVADSVGGDGIEQVVA